MKKLVVILALCSLGQAFAQKDSDYYTDSDVRKRIIGLGVHVNPFYNNSRLLTNTFNPGQLVTLIDQSTEGSWKMGGGLDLYISLTSRFEIVSGVNFGQAEFSYPTLLFQGMNDTAALAYSLNEMVDYVNIPLGISFKSDLDNGWWLEVIPGLEFSRLLRYEGDFVRGGNAETEDFMPQTQDLYTWVSFQLGGTFRPFDTWGYSVRFQGRYMLNSLIQQDIYLRETLYNIGLNAGIQYRF
jgi:hypothetical protein